VVKVVVGLEEENEVVEGVYDERARGPALAFGMAPPLDDNVVPAVVGAFSLEMRAA
jgi:hypothetical protein